MTLNEFMIMLQKQVDKGYGDKDLLMESPHQCNHHIHSVQMNTCPGIEPDYLFIMAGEEQEPEQEQSLFEKYNPYNYIDNDGGNLPNG